MQAPAWMQAPRTIEELSLLGTYDLNCWKEYHWLQCLHIAGAHIPFQSISQDPVPISIGADQVVVHKAESLEFGIGPVEVGGESLPTDHFIELNTTGKTIGEVSNFSLAYEFNELRIIWEKLLWLIEE